MLKQLLKYDFRSTGRILIPAYCTFIGITVVSYLTNTVFVGLAKDSAVTDIVATIIFMVLILGMSVLPLLTLLVLVVDFYRNMVSRGGYLTYTLPVRLRTVVLSKIIIAMVWEITAVFLFAVAVFAIASSPQMQIDWSAVPKEAEFVLSVRFWCVLAFWMWVGLVSEALIGYFSVAIASLFQKHKVIMSFVVYFASDATIQVLLMLMGFFAGLFGIISDSVENMGAEMEILLASSGIIYLLVGIVGSIISCRIFEKKANLE